MEQLGLRERMARLERPEQPVQLVQQEQMVQLERHAEVIRDKFLEEAVGLLWVVELQRWQKLLLQHQEQQQKQYPQSPVGLHQTGLGKTTRQLQLLLLCPLALDEQLQREELATSEIPFHSLQ